MTHVDPPPSLLSHHWKDAEKKNEVEETIPALEDAVSGHETFRRLAAKVAFLAPLRVLVHRVDLVAPVNVNDLKSFPDSQIEKQEARGAGGDEVLAGHAGGRSGAAVEVDRLQPHLAIAARAARRWPGEGS